MHKQLAMCGAVLFLATAAAAQDNSAILAAPRPASARASSPASDSYELLPWQVAVSYEYLRLDGFGTHINTNGFNTSLTRLSKRWLGLEADVGATWGTAPDGTTTKFLWYGGGPRFLFHRQAKFTPWVHGLFGGAHLFPRAPFSPNAFGFIAGGGVDIRVGRRISWRVQGDFVGTRFAGAWQKNEQVKTGLAFHF